MQSVAAMVSMVILEMSLTDRGKTSSKIIMVGVVVVMMMVDEDDRKVVSILNLSEN